MTKIELNVSEIVKLIIIYILFQTNDGDDGGGGGDNWRNRGNTGNSWQGKAPKKTSSTRTAPYNNGDKTRAPIKCGICREPGLLMYLSN